MRKLNYLLIPLILASSACKKEERPQTEEEILETIPKDFKPGKPRVLILYGSELENEIGKEYRFYDLDGDGKTVEHYVETFGNIYGRPIGDRVDLIKEGVKPVYNPENDRRIRRIMRVEDEVGINKKYKNLLRILNESEK